MNKLLERYVPLVDFLGEALGEYVEIVLQDVTGDNYSIVKIANNHISNRQVGAPLTNLALQMIASDEWKNKDYICDYYGTSVDGRLLKGSTFFIKEEGKLIGMLCINADVSIYHDVSERLLKLAGIKKPDVITENTEPESVNKETIERFSDSVVDVTKTVLDEVCGNLPIDRLTQNEKMEIVEKLSARGVFLLKGAVSDVAKVLLCSEASVYRYLSKVTRN